MTEMRDVRLGQRGDTIEYNDDGSIILSSPELLKPYARNYSERLKYWADEKPDATFLGQRNPDDDGWMTLTYGDAYKSILHISQGLLNRGLSQVKPLIILSGNDFEHALMGLSALFVGVPYAPLSVGYSLLSKDFAKLRHCFELIDPGLVYVSDGALFQRAIESIVPSDVEVVVGRNPLPERNMATFEQLKATKPTDAVYEAAGAVTGDTVGRLLFTSGSTSMPKGTINTHRVLCANQQMIAQSLPFLVDSPPIMCDWLPWNHTFGGNHMFGTILYGGGSMFIDNGLPVPGGIEKSVRNLSEVRPTFIANIPKALELILPFLEKEEGFRNNFFSRLNGIFYTAASLPEAVFKAYRNLSEITIGKRIFTVSALGATETGPAVTICNWDTPQLGAIGLPIPGVKAKLIPNRGKLEIRVKSPSIIPGYWKQPEKTAEAFDEDGWYKMGDAVCFIDSDNPSEGLLFDGRVVEDFKLSTGTWVNVALLRISATDIFASLISQVLVCGHSRDEIGLVVFPDFEYCRQLAKLPQEASVNEILSAKMIQTSFQQRLDLICAQGTGSSNRIARIILTDKPPSDIEVTDKNTLSTNVALECRAEEIERLYSGEKLEFVFNAKRDMVRERQ